MMIRDLNNIGNVLQIVFTIVKKILRFAQVYRWTRKTFLADPASDGMLTSDSIFVRIQIDRRSITHRKQQSRFLELRWLYHNSFARSSRKIPRVSLNTLILVLPHTRVSSDPHRHSHFHRLITPSLRHPSEINNEIRQNDKISIPNIRPSDHRPIDPFKPERDFSTDRSNRCYREDWFVFVDEPFRAFVRKMFHSRVTILPRTTEQWCRTTWSTSGCVWA